MRGIVIVGCYTAFIKIVFMEKFKDDEQLWYNDTDMKLMILRGNSQKCKIILFSTRNDTHIFLSSFSNLFPLIVLTMGLFSPFPVLLLTDPFSLTFLFAFSMEANLGVRAVSSERVYALEPFFIC